MSHEDYAAEQFGSYQAQQHAARLGMWIFIGTEILLFGGLFCAYAMYRTVYPEAFLASSRHMDVTIGTVNTFVLLVSSVFVALALAFIRRGRELLTTVCLVVAILLGLTFLVLKGVEYAEHALMHLAVPPDQREDLASAIAAATAGKGALTLAGRRWVDQPVAGSRELP